MLTIRVTSKFEKQYRKLPREIKAAAEKKEVVFRENPFDASLKTHKLHGKDSETWAFWVDYDYRIKYIFVGKQDVLFLEIGKHDIYR